MNLEEKKNKIYEYLDKPATIYELSAASDYSVSMLYNYLKTLEVVGLVKKVRGRNGKIVWMKPNKTK